MIKIIFIILLLIGFSYLFFPYLSQLFTYFGLGQSQLVTIIDYITQFIGSVLNILATKTYFMIFISVLIFISLIFYLINSIGGTNE